MLFSFQEDKTIETYQIIKLDYTLNITITVNSILIKNNHTSILITVPVVFDGKKRFVLSDEALYKTTVLHSVVETDPIEMYRHLYYAFKHIVPNFSEHHQCYLYNAILSLKKYHKITYKFRLLWENELIQKKYKLLKYTMKQERTKRKMEILSSKIKILEAEFKNSCNDKSWVDKF
jgi:hypothetical protein